MTFTIPDATRYTVESGNILKVRAKGQRHTSLDSPSTFTHTLISTIGMDYRSYYTKYQCIARALDTNSTPVEICTKVIEPLYSAVRDASETRDEGSGTTYRPMKLAIQLCSEQPDSDKTIQTKTGCVAHLVIRPTICHYGLAPPAEKQTVESLVPGPEQPFFKKVFKHFTSEPSVALESEVVTQIAVVDPRKKTHHDPAEAVREYNSVNRVATIALAIPVDTADTEDPLCKNCNDPDTLSARLSSIDIVLTHEDVGTLRRVKLLAIPYFRQAADAHDKNAQCPDADTLAKAKPGGHGLDEAIDKCHGCSKASVSNASSNLIAGVPHVLYESWVPAEEGGEGITVLQKKCKPRTILPGAPPPFLEIQHMTQYGKTLGGKTLAMDYRLCLFHARPQKTDIKDLDAYADGALMTWGNATPGIVTYPLFARLEYAPTGRLQCDEILRCPPGGVSIRFGGANNVCQDVYEHADGVSKHIAHEGGGAFVVIGHGFASAVGEAGNMDNKPKHFMTSHSDDASDDGAILPPVVYASAIEKKAFLLDDAVTIPTQQRWTVSPPVASISAWDADTTRLFKLVGKITDKPCAEKAANKKAAATFVYDGPGPKHGKTMMVTAVRRSKPTQPHLVVHYAEVEAFYALCPGPSTTFEEDTSGTVKCMSQTRSDTNPLVQGGFTFAPTADEITELNARAKVVPMQCTLRVTCKEENNSFSIISGYDNGAISTKQERLMQTELFFVFTPAGAETSRKVRLQSVTPRGDRTAHLVFNNGQEYSAKTSYDKMIAKESKAKESKAKAKDTKAKEVKANPTFLQGFFGTKTAESASGTGSSTAADSSDTAADSSDTAADSSDTAEETSDTTTLIAATVGVVVVHVVGRFMLRT
jgi:hypothetical protein